MNSETVSLHVPIFNTGSTKAPMKLLMLLNNIFKGDNINNGPHHYSTIKNILDGEALQFSG